MRLVSPAGLHLSEAMGFQEEYDFDLLRNEAESRIIAELQQQTRELDESLKTPEAILDMAAYALNRVRPRYRVTLLGSLYTRTVADDEYEREVRDAVTAAISTVMENPPPA